MSFQHSGEESIPQVWSKLKDESAGEPSIKVLTSGHDNGAATKKVAVKPPPGFPAPVHSKASLQESQQAVVDDTKQPQPATRISVANNDDQFDEFMEAMLGL